MSSVFKRRIRGQLQRTYTIAFRDRFGLRHVRGTPCTKREDAKAIADQLERDWHLIRLGVAPPQQLESRDNLQLSIDVARERYIAHLKQGGRGERHVKETAWLIGHVAALAGVSTVGQITLGSIEKLKDALVAAGKSSRTVNRYTALLQALHKFIMSPPAARVRHQAKRERRAFTPAEFARLIAEPRVVKKGRHVQYLLNQRTGLRFSESARLRWSMVRDDQTLGAHLQLPATITKNKRAAVLPIAADLLEQLAPLRPMTTEDRLIFARRIGRRTWEQDVKRCGVQYADDAGRILGMHSLRHTFDTWLFRSGAPAHLVQWLMRHSASAEGVSDLTMGVYADKRQMLGELRAAVESMVKWQARELEPKSKEATA